MRDSSRTKIVQDIYPEPSLCLKFVVPALAGARCMCPIITGHIQYAPTKMGTTNRNCL